MSQIIYLLVPTKCQNSCVEALAKLLQLLRAQAFQRTHPAPLPSAHLYQPVAGVYLLEGSPTAPACHLRTRCDCKVSAVRNCAVTHPFVVREERSPQLQN